jgi:hypothetical protein
LIRYVEAGPLPKRVRFYGLRRRLSATQPHYALAIGAAVGAACTGAAALLLQVFTS